MVTLKGPLPNLWLALTTNFTVAVLPIRTIKRFF